MVDWVHWNIIPAAVMAFAVVDSPPVALLAVIIEPLVTTISVAAGDPPIWAFAEIAETRPPLVARMPFVVAPVRVALLQVISEPCCASTPRSHPVALALDASILPPSLAKIPAPPQLLAVPPLKQTDDPD